MALRNALGGRGEQGPMGPFTHRVSLVLGARTRWGVAQGPRRSLGCQGHGRWLCHAGVSHCCPDRGAAGDTSHCWDPLGSLGTPG